MTLYESFTYLLTNPVCGTHHSLNVIQRPLIPVNRQIPVMTKNHLEKVL